MKTKKSHFAFLILIDHKTYPVSILNVTNKNVLVEERARCCFLMKERGVNIFTVYYYA